MPKPRKKNRPNAKGRNPTSRFVRLPHELLNSAAYRSLTPNARGLLVELTMLDNGKNNGSLYLSVRDARDRLGLADTTAAKNGFDELAEKGFIEITFEAHFHIKASEGSRARCWRLTWLHWPSRKIATWDFLDWEPAPSSRSWKRMERGQKALARYRKALSSGRLPVREFDTTDEIEQSK